jgi:hypothetical protein
MLGGLVTLVDTVCIDAPVAAVWRHLAQLEDIQLWSSAVVAARCDGPVRRGIGAERSCDLRGGITITERWLAWDEGRSFAYEGSGIPLVAHARNEWALTAAGTKTLLTTQAEVTLKGDPASRLLEPLVRFQSRRMGRRALAAFKFLVETGAPPAAGQARLPAPRTCCRRSVDSRHSAETPGRRSRNRYDEPSSGRSRRRASPPFRFNADRFQRRGYHLLPPRRNHRSPKLANAPEVRAHLTAIHEPRPCPTVELLERELLGHLRHRTAHESKPDARRPLERHCLQRHGRQRTNPGEVLGKHEIHSAFHHTQLIRKRAGCAAKIGRGGDIEHRLARRPNRHLDRPQRAQPPPNGDVHRQRTSRHQQIRATQPETDAGKANGPSDAAVVSPTHAFVEQSGLESARARPALSTDSVPRPVTY